MSSGPDVDVVEIRANRSHASNFSQTITNLRVPSDKSVTHRALIFAAMARGVSRVLDPLMGADCLATLKILAALGVRSEVSELDGTSVVLQIDSPGFDQWVIPVEPLDCMNSGTTARLMMGLIAAHPELRAEFIGDESLSRRPMGRLVNPLRLMGARVEGDGERLPLKVFGQRLRPQVLSLQDASAQLKSALLLAAMNVHGETVVELPAGSRDHTERFLRFFGAAVRSELLPAGLEKISFQGPFRPEPLQQLGVPADPSSAAFFVVLAAIRPDVRLCLREVLSNPTRDGALQKIRAAGVRIEIEPKHDALAIEVVVDVRVEATSSMKAFSIDAVEVPTLIDEVPILAVLALFCEGQSVFKGLKELRIKESDRLNKVLQLLRLCGGRAHVTQEDLYIEGCGSEWTPTSFRFDSAGDHRMAMSAAILATRCAQPCQILNAACVSVSFPNFYDFLNQLDVATFSHHD